MKNYQKAIRVDLHNVPVSLIVKDMEDSYHRFHDLNLSGRVWEIDGRDVRKIVETVTGAYQSVSVPSISQSMDYQTLTIREVIGPTDEPFSLHDNIEEIWVQPCNSGLFIVLCVCFENVTDRLSLYHSGPHTIWFKEKTDA